MDEISEEKLEAISASNIRLLEEAESDQGKNYEEVWQSEIEGHPQPELIAVLLENLEEEEGFAVRSKNRFLVRSFAKIALDSLM